MQSQAIAPTPSDILSYHERGALMEDDHSRPNENMAVEPPTNLQGMERENQCVFYLGIVMIN